MKLQNFLFINFKLKTNCKNQSIVNPFFIEAYLHVYNNDVYKLNEGQSGYVYIYSQNVFFLQQRYSVIHASSRKNTA